LCKSNRIYTYELVLILFTNFPRLDPGVLTHSQLLLSTLSNFRPHTTDLLRHSVQKLVVCCMREMPLFGGHALLSFHRASTTPSIGKMVALSKITELGDLIACSESGCLPENANLGSLRWRRCSREIAPILRSDNNLESGNSHDSQDDVRLLGIHGMLLGLGTQIAGRHRLPVCDLRADNLLQPPRVVGPLPQAL